MMLRAGPLFMSAGEVARQAVDADVHVVGVSSQAAGHMTLVPQLVAALKEEGMTHVLVVLGGIVPEQVCGVPLPAPPPNNRKESFLRQETRVSCDEFLASFTCTVSVLCAGVLSGIWPRAGVWFSLPFTPETGCFGGGYSRWGVTPPVC
jgi:hypothetical protein